MESSEKAFLLGMGLMLSGMFFIFWKIFFGGGLLAWGLGWTLYLPGFLLGVPIQWLLGKRKKKKLSEL